MIDNIGDACESIYPTQFAVNAVMAESVSQGRAQLHDLKPDACGAEFIRHGSERVCTLHECNYTQNHLLLITGLQV